jgi:2-isopropylmalate synthase
VRGGARQIECTINGVGERAGNASLEEVVMAMRVRPDRLPFETAIDTPSLYRTSQLLSALTGEPVQANKAIVGRNAFAHEAGIHQDGVLKDRRTYEIMRPEDVGVPSMSLVLGKHSGRHALKHRCDELNIPLTRLELDRVYRAMIARADTQKTITDADVRDLVDRFRDEAREQPDAASQQPAARPQRAVDVLPLNARPATVKKAISTPSAAVPSGLGHTPHEAGYGHGV